MPKMPLFEPLGPFKIPRGKGRGGSYIEEGCPRFWERYPGSAEERGRYIFAIRAGKGIRPVYVGKATRSFKQECFAAHKIAQHYAPELAQFARGTPVLLLLAAPGRPSKRQARRITELEKFLIQQAVLKNPALSNVHHRKSPSWGIRGVLRTGKGQPSRSASHVREVLGLR